jgi:nucleoid-associated protein YgaU
LTKGLKLFIVLHVSLIINAKKEVSMKKVLVGLVTILLMIGCTHYASQEQMDELAARELAVEGLRAEVANAEGTLSDLDMAKTDKEAKLIELETDVAELKEKVRSCPAVVDDLYRVEPGDYLAKIAAKEGISSWKKIYDLNKDKIKDPNIILPGWDLNLPK